MSPTRQTTRARATKAKSPATRQAARTKAARTKSPAARRARPDKGADRRSATPRPAAGTKRRGSDGDSSVRRPFRSGRFVRMALIAMTIALAAVLGASSVRTWADQRSQIDRAKQEASDLDARIASLEAEIATRTSDEGARIEALCFGPYVEPGVEVYSIPGVDGCVTGN